MAAAARSFLLLAFSGLALALAPAALAGGGSYTFDGGTERDRSQVRAALEASAFDWGLVPATVTVHIGRGEQPRSARGHVWLDSDLLAAGKFGWAVVQDEFAHQLDYYLFDDVVRAELTATLGARDWCYGIAGLAHAQYGCERFASTLVWAYWPSPDNAYRPTSAASESAALAPAAFRALMGQLLGARDALAVTAPATPTPIATAAARPAAKAIVAKAPKARAGRAATKRP